MKHIQSIVDIHLHDINETGILFEFTLPVIDHLHAFGRELGRKSQFKHLTASCQLDNKAFLLCCIFWRGVPVVHAVATQTLCIACGTYDLTHEFIGEVLVRLKILLTWHIHRVFLGIVVGNTAAVETDWNKVVACLQDEVID